MKTTKNFISFDKSISSAQTQVKHEENLRHAGVFRKFAITLFATLAVAFLISGATVLTTFFLPYATFTLVSLVIFKIITMIFVIAFGSFGLTKFLDYIAPKLPRSLAKAANIIHAFITEVFSIIVLLASYLVNLQKMNPKKVEDSSQRPILMIHGLYHNSSSWIDYRDKLQAAQVGPIFTINLGNPFASITMHAAKVKKMVDEIQHVTGRKDLMLVCHSMGGLVGAKFALDFASADTKITDLITIGTPWDGTYVAYLGIGKSAKEMWYQGNYVKDLSRRISQTSIRRLIIASEIDQMVLPPKSAFLSIDQSEQTVRLLISNLGHCGILYSNQIAEKIYQQYQTKK